MSIELFSKRSIRVGCIILLHDKVANVLPDLRRSTLSFNKMKQSRSELVLISPLSQLEDWFSESWKLCLKFCSRRCLLSKTLHKFLIMVIYPFFLKTLKLSLFPISTLSFFQSVLTEGKDIWWKSWFTAARLTFYHNFSLRLYLVLEWLEQIILRLWNKNFFCKYFL